MISELSVLEKALGKSDLAAQKSPLESILKSLLPMRLSSLDQLDLNTRGRLLTSLLRVQRQPKPPPAEPGAEPESPAAPSAAGEAGQGETPSETASSTVMPPSVRELDQGISEGSPQLTAEMAQAEGAASSTVEAPVSSELPENAAAPQETGISDGSPQLTAEASTEPKGPTEDPKTKAWADVIQLVGRVWRAAGDQERAQNAFELSGRPTPPQDSAPAKREEPREARGDRPERGERKGARPERGEKRERPPRGDRPERPARPERAARPERGPKVERKPAVTEAPIAGLTPELQAKLHEAIAASNQDAAREALKELPPESVGPALEREKAWDLLMEHHIQRGNFDDVARLYERARQFDQAALAWEKAGKFTPARKAYERVRDFTGANRMRQKEVGSLIERGDRLGAATLLMSGGLRKEAREIIEQLPPIKAYHFLTRVKLEEEAQQLADRELAKAEAENKPAQKARWLEVLGKKQEAVDVYLAADRKDRAYPIIAELGDVPRAAQMAEEAGHHGKAVDLYRKAGDTANAERVAALPPPPPRSAPEPASPEGE